MQNTFCLRSHSYWLLLVTFVWLLLPYSATADNTTATKLPDSNNQIIKLTDRGIQPNILRMKLSDSILFLLNDSSNSLATIEINFEKRQLHCAGSNTEVTPDGKLRSKHPIEPQSFVTTCFHEPGEYALTAYGLPLSPLGSNAKIIVE